MTQTCNAEFNESGNADKHTHSCAQVANHFPVNHLCRCGANWAEAATDSVQGNLAHWKRIAIEAQKAATTLANDVVALRNERNVSNSPVIPDSSESRCTCKSHIHQTGCYAAQNPNTFNVICGVEVDRCPHCLSLESTNDALRLKLDLAMGGSAGIKFWQKQSEDREKWLKEKESANQQQAEEIAHWKNIALRHLADKTNKDAEIERLTQALEQTGPHIKNANALIQENNDLQAECAQVEDALVKRDAEIAQLSQGNENLRRRISDVLEQAKHDPHLCEMQHEEKDAEIERLSKRTNDQAHHQLALESECERLQAEARAVRATSEHWMRQWQEADAKCDAVKRAAAELIKANGEQFLLKEAAHAEIARLTEELETKKVQVCAPGGGDAALIDDALKEAVAGIYFADSSDYLGALWGVVRRLSPRVAAILEEDPRKAYDFVHGDKETETTEAVSAGAQSITGCPSCTSLSNVLKLAEEGLRELAELARASCYISLRSFRFAVRARAVQALSAIQNMKDSK